jgi:hypothetical protein
MGRQYKSGPDPWLWLWPEPGLAYSLSLWPHWPGPGLAWPGPGLSLATGLSLAWLAWPLA